MMVRRLVVAGTHAEDDWAAGLLDDAGLPGLPPGWNGATPPPLQRALRPAGYHGNWGAGRRPCVHRAGQSAGRSMG